MIFFLFIIWLTIAVSGIIFSLYWTAGQTNGYWEQMTKFLDERDRKIIAKLTNKDHK